MAFYKNDTLQYIQLEDSAAVFDPANGETHVLDSIAYEILDKCVELGSRDAVIRYFCEHYEGDAEEIASDVEGFIQELTQKGILGEEHVED